MNAATPNPSARRRDASFVRVLFASMGVGVITGGAAAILGATGLAPLPVAYVGAVLLAGVIGLWFSYRWWLAVDEAVRAAHTTSWFWGGSSGMLVVGAIAVGLLSIALGQARPVYGLDPQEAALILTGILLTVVLMLIGYGLWWAGWWFTRSR